MRIKEPSYLEIDAAERKLHKFNEDANRQNEAKNNKNNNQAVKGIKKELSAELVDKPEQTDKEKEIEKKKLEEKKK